ncbi:Tfp pilus assembly protein FimT/FimU [Schleiferilactobacillus harbinensis]|uniref:Tfp pilus assembly protein FimT/FimU n=1 Tax=Schleiferilactobacillus harbinensis TaxID=304207 RepID=UPI00345ED5EF
MNKASPAFTLAETLIVVACVCALGLLAVPHVQTLGRATATRAFLDRFKATYEKYENRARLTQKNYHIELGPTVQAARYIFVKQETETPKPPRDEPPKAKDWIDIPATLTATVNRTNPKIGPHGVENCTWTFQEIATRTQYQITVQMKWGRLIETKT